MSKLSNIQILRALAAMLVVIYHTGIETTSVCQATARGCSYDFWMAGYGVCLFFMISGFIMVTTSWESFGVSGAPLSFMRRRLARIVPLYWLATTIAVVGVFFVPSMLKDQVLDTGYVIGSYLFWPMMRASGFVRPIANLGWTLNIEMMFYVVFSIGLFFNRRAGMAAVVLFLCALTGLQMTGLFGAGGAAAFVPLNFWGDPIILNFIIGMLAAVAYRKGYRLTAAQTWGALALALAFSAFTHSFHDTTSTFPEDNFLRRMCDTLPCFFILIAGAFGPQLNVKSSLTRAALLIGDASYSLYLLHPFALRALTKLWIKLVGDHLPVWPFALTCLCAALLVGLLSYWFVEKPMIDYFHRKSQNAQVRAPRSLA